MSLRHWKVIPLPQAHRGGSRKNWAKAPGPTLLTCIDTPESRVSQTRTGERIKRDSALTLFGPDGPTDSHIRWESGSRDSEPTKRSVSQMKLARRLMRTYWTRDCRYDRRNTGGNGKIKLLVSISKELRKPLKLSMLAIWKDDGWTDIVNNHALFPIRINSVDLKSFHSVSILLPVVCPQISIGIRIAFKSIYLSSPGPQPRRLDL